MASKLSYQRLRQEVLFDHERRIVLGRTPRQRGWLGVLRRRRKFRFRVKIAGLRRFFRVRRAKSSWSKIVKRLKESRSHWGDLFAGNYLFMQVAPTTLNKNRIEKIAMDSNYKVSGLFDPRYIIA